MQEADIAAREILCRYIQVTNAPQTLTWWFNSKKKNVSFGIYFKPAGAITTPKIATDSANPEDSSVGDSYSKSTNSPRNSRKLSRAVTAPSTPADATLAQGLFIQSPVAHKPEKSSVSRLSFSWKRRSLDDPANSMTENNGRQIAEDTFIVTEFGKEGLVELMPINHYESSKSTIRGEMDVTEPGLCILVFGI